MTTNQINYYKAKIDEAHYGRSDAETARHNYAVEQLQREQNEELRRANLAKETELHRSNVANENNYYLNLLENARHNQATEALTSENLAITAERAKYQNLLDASNVDVNNARVENINYDTTLKGYQIENQVIKNASDTLDYNLDVAYKEWERVSAPLKNTKVGSFAAGFGNALVGIFNSSSIPSSRYVNPHPTLKYFDLNSY